MNIITSREWWRKAYKCSINFTSDTNLMWFQIRITHRIISTNSFLYKIGVLANDKCSFCKNESEDIIHLYWSCDIVKQFWRDFDEWICQKTGVILELRPADVFFGKFEAPRILNLMICLGKFHIHKRRLKNVKPNLEVVKKEILDYYNIEKYIFAKNCDSDKFLNRWSPMAHLFS